MEPAAWITALDQRITRRPRGADRSWAWAHVAHVISLGDLLASTSPIPGATCWVEPRMAWTLDELTCAGARTDTFLLPVVDPAHAAAALDAVLGRLIDAAGAPDPGATPEQAEACAQAVVRATEARRDHAASTP